MVLVIRHSRTANGSLPLSNCLALGLQPWEKLKPRQNTNRCHFQFLTSWRSGQIGKQPTGLENQIPSFTRSIADSVSHDGLPI